MSQKNCGKVNCSLDPVWAQFSNLGDDPASHAMADEDDLLRLSLDDLTQKRLGLREEIGHLKLKRSTNRLENPMKLKETKRDLARVETILREKTLQGKRG